MSRLILLVSLLFSAGMAYPASCVKTGTVCADSTPCKTISGVSVCLNDPGINSTCWKFTDSYKCIKPNAVDYCAAFASMPGCFQTNSVCSANDTSFGTGCMTWTNTWRCGAGLATPPNTVMLGTTYTITNNTLDTTACTSYSSNPSCTLSAHTCTDTTPSKVIGGLTVTLAEAGGCWSYTDSYSCLGSMSSTCDPLIAKGCTLSSSKCIKTGLSGTCTLNENVYNCPSTPGTTSTLTDCGASKYCTGGNCFNSGHIPDADLAQTAAMMETIREAGNYMDVASMKIFNGENQSCTNTFFGLFNCCKPSGNASSNSNIIGSSVMSAGGQVLKYGSSYVYDTLFDNSHIVRGFDSMLNSTPVGSLVGGSSAGFSPSFGLYGFSVSFGAAPAGASVLGSAGGFTFAFDPTSLAISVAIMVITDLMSCTPDEKKLSMKTGQNLCRFTGSFCSIEIPLVGICLQTTQTYCCFNSRLAKIINAAGGAQLGRPTTNCSGFTPAEFSAIDFSRVDLSEFTAEIMANIKMPSTTAVGTDVTNTMKAKISNYYTTGKQ